MTQTQFTPWWWEAAEPETLPATDVESTCDVVVVGGGFAGLSASIELARAGKSVQVFDADDPGRGASSRNGGMASGNLKWGVHAMAEKFGTDKARALYAEGREARHDLADFLRDENVDCDFDMTGRFTGAMTPTNFQALKKECAALNDLVEIDAKLVAREDQGAEIGSDIYHGGLLRPDIGGLHPGKMHQGILRVAQSAGVLVHGKTAITALDRNGGDNAGFTVTTTRGVVTCANVLVATNGYTTSSLPWLARRVIPIPSQIIATEVLPADVMNRFFPKKRMHGETKRIFHYYRPCPEGKRILLGGRATGPLEQPDKLAENLRQRLIGIFPELSDVKLTHSWWGYVAMTFDFLPHLHVNDGVHYATGFNGSGVVWARWVGKKAAYKLLGDERAVSAFDSGTFPTRPLYSGKPWFLPAAIAWEQTKDRIDLRRG